MNRVFTAPAFLDPFTCRRIRRAMDRGTVEPAEVLDGEIQPQEGVRRASHIEVPSDLLADVERLLDTQRDVIGRFFGLALSEREGPSFLRYPEGGFYRPHRDRGASPAWPGAARRQVAVVVFLNSSRDVSRHGGFAGGALQLYLDAEPMDVHPAEGLLAAFPADVLHQVSPVREGSRDTIVDWYY